MNEKVQPGKNYGLKVAADVWGVSLPAVRLWASQGRFPTLKFGRRRVISGETILHIRDHGITPKPDTR